MNRFLGITALAMAATLGLSGVAFASSTSSKTHTATKSASGTAHSSMKNASGKTHSAMKSTNGKHKGEVACKGAKVYAVAATKTYYEKGETMYGHAKGGSYMCMAAANGKGYHHASSMTKKGKPNTMKTTKHAAKTSKKPPKKH